MSFLQKQSSDMISRELSRIKSFSLRLKLLNARLHDEEPNTSVKQTEHVRFLCHY